MKRIRKHNSSNIVFLGIRVELWKVIQGYRLVIDIKDTRHIFHLCGYTSCSTKNLI